MTTIDDLHQLLEKEWSATTRMKKFLLATDLVIKGWMERRGLQDLALFDSGKGFLKRGAYARELQRAREHEIETKLLIGFVFQTGDDEPFAEKSSGVRHLALRHTGPAKSTAAITTAVTQARFREFSRTGDICYVGKSLTGRALQCAWSFDVVRMIKAFRAWAQSNPNFPFHTVL
ncbi:MAG: hypothetical protein R3E09_11500 [Novosphingobium sp.]